MTLYSREYDFIYFYITLFKALDPRVAFLLEYAETLVDASLLSIDDVAKYSNTVSADTVAHCCSENYSVSFAISLLTNANITTSRAAAILNSTRFDADKAAKIIDSMSLTTAVAILNNANLSASKAASILSNPYVSVSKVYSILANAGLSADKTQSILFNMPIGSRFIDIVTTGASNVTYTSNTSISGTNRYNILSIASGVTLSLGGQPNVIIAKTIINYGTMDKTVTGASGGASVGGSGAGGQGGGGIIIFCDTFNNIGTIRANGGNGSNATGANAYGAGNAGGSGAFYRVGSDSAGTGGRGGGIAGGSGGINGGGGGGVTTWALSGGTGDGSSITTFSSYSDLADDIKQAVADWFIRNVLGKSPTTSKPFPNIRGSGGGSGCCDYDYIIGTYNSGGGGGGGGGHILVICLTANNTGSFVSTGGNGGNGYGTQGAGGGGGAGGLIYLLYKTIMNIGALTSSGGSGGTGSGGSGNAGGAGTVRVAMI
jgi:hypothetical protein